MNIFIIFYSYTILSLNIKKEDREREREGVNEKRIIGRKWNQTDRDRK